MNEQLDIHIIMHNNEKIVDKCVLHVIKFRDAQVFWSA